MGMDQELAAMYNTPGRHVDEDQTKLAEAELFCKLAAENGINLNDLTDSQVQQLWNSTFAKEAEDSCSKCEKPKSECKCEEAPAEDKVAAAAAAEFQQKQEWNEKVAQCDKLGRIMAHAYIEELGLIHKASEKVAGEMPPQFAAAAPSEEKKEEEKEEGEEGKKEEEKEGPKHEEKEASAIDQLAAKRAVELAKQAGLNEKVAAKRVDAVLTLGLAPETTKKTASARSVQENIHIRALEFLETAGYPVDWNK